MELKIDPEFQSLVPPLSQEEYEQLKLNIIKDGCREPLSIWAEDEPSCCKNCHSETGFDMDCVDGKWCYVCKKCGHGHLSNPTIIDGHNRYKICTENNIDFDYEYMDFESKNDVKIWIINNQLGRRNLPPFIRIELKIKAEDIKNLVDKAKDNQGTRTDILLTSVKSIEPVNTTQKIAISLGIGHDSVTKAKKIIEKAPEKVKEAVRNNEISINKAYKDIVRQEKRQQIQEEIVLNPIPDGVFDVVYSDPPWRYEHSETHNRDIENQYPTMDLENIKSLKIPVADNAVLLLWATAPKLTEALEVMSAWGFKYRTCAVWDKEMIGMGYWVRGQHELLLFGVKGDFSPPEPNVRESSVYRERRTEHSKKPDHYYEMIESYFPNGRYLELFARQKHNDRWSVWGNQIA